MLPLLRFQQFNLIIKHSPIQHIRIPLHQPLKKPYSTTNTNDIPEDLEQKFIKYKTLLKNKGYFQGVITGSPEYNERLDEARKKFLEYSSATENQTTESDSVDHKSFLERVKSYQQRSKTKSSQPKPVLLFEMKNNYKWITRINALFTMAAVLIYLFIILTNNICQLQYPVHFWGFYLHVDPLLLIFPFSFSLLWTYYSLKKCQSTIFRATLLEDNNTVQFVTLSFFGLEKSSIISKSRLKTVFSTDDSQDRTHVDYFKPISTSSENMKSKRIRYIIEKKKGQIFNPVIYNSIFIY